MVETLLAAPAPAPRLTIVVEREEDRALVDAGIRRHRP
jgi:hypothetical protein